MSLRKVRRNEKMDFSALWRSKCVVYNGRELGDYLFREDGNILSMKNYSGEPGWKHKILKPRVTGKSPYPGVTLSVDGKPTRVVMHRLVCENFHKFPNRYPGITAKDWKKTPVSVRKELIKNLQVNHKDGDRTNYHPSNLEWTTGKQNRDHYHQVLRGKRM